MIFFQDQEFLMGHHLYKLSLLHWTTSTLHPTLDAINPPPALDPINSIRYPLAGNDSSALHTSTLLEVGDIQHIRGILQHYAPTETQQKSLVTRSLRVTSPILTSQIQQALPHWHALMFMQR